MLKRERRLISLTKINDEEKLPYSAEKIVPNKMQEAALEGLRNIRNREKIGHSLSVPQVLVRHFYLPLTLNNIILNACYSSFIANRFSKNL